MSNPAIMMHVPFALNGQKSNIKVSLDSSDSVQTASYNYGFPNATMTPKSSGGKPPNGKDFNGLFYAITLDLIHRQSGKQIQYDATYATNIGGYAKGSVLQSTDLTKSYISTADGNLTDPDSSSSKNWSVYSQPPLATSTTVGTVKISDTLTSTATDTALTANQGNVLNSKKINYSDTVDNLTGTSATHPLSANMGASLYGMMLGVGQKWQDVSSSRSSGVSYTNNTGRPIVVSVGCGGRDANVTITVDGVVVAMSKDTYDGSQPRASDSAIVPNGSIYVCTLSAISSYTLTFWSEFR